MNRATADDRDLSIVIVGASGDLARRKIFPALFSLHCQDLLPPGFMIFGFARSDMDDDTFRAQLAEHLTCRYTPEHDCAGRMETFLSRCRYVRGRYDDADSFLDLFTLLKPDEEGRANRLFYLAVPPLVFSDVARAMGDSGLVNCGEHDPWTRVVIEKPFGHDRASSDRLAAELNRVFTEEQIFRIDHYLGKEVIQNLMVLRFANLVFEPLWNRRFIEQVTITWSETQGVEGRGGYFDRYGIVRDVMQNHLLQILALVAMEPPARMESNAVRDAKVRVLRAVQPVRPDDLLLGQYTATVTGGRQRPGYTDDPTVPADSRTPTFAAVNLRIENDRWRGVPFRLSAGKALDSRMTEIRIRFRALPRNPFAPAAGAPPANELIIRVQPDESITLRIAGKVPALDLEIAPHDLDLQYRTAFSRVIPDAYEDLLLDVLRGERSLFIRSDELAAAWDIFTPALHAVDRQGIVPLPYPSGSSGPETAGNTQPQA